MAASSLTQNLHLAALTGAAFVAEQGEQVHLIRRTAGGFADLSDVQGLALALARECVASDANDYDDVVS